MALAHEREVAEQKLALTQQANAVTLSHQRRLNDESYRAEEGQRQLRRSDRRDVERHQHSLHDMSTAAAWARQNAETAGVRTRQTIETAGKREREAIETAGVSGRLALTTAAYKEQKRIEVDSRQQIGHEERKMIDHRSQADERKHQWTMDQLALAKAIPIGPAQMIGSSTDAGGNKGLLTM